MKKQKMDLAREIERAGYTGISDFHKHSKIDVAFETVRRAVQGNRSTWTFFLILDALGLSKDAIRAALEAEGDTVLPKYLEAAGEIMDTQETAILDAIRKIKSKPNCDYVANSLSGWMELAGRASDVDLSSEIKKVKKGG